ERLPVSMRPSHVGVLEALPRRPNGKLDRGALPGPDRGWRRSHRDLDPAVRPGADGGGSGASRDRGLGEAGIGARAAATSPGADDDFFALGGHSLLAMRLIARLKDRLGVDLPLIAIFEHPTIAGLAPVVASLPVLRPAEPLPSRRRGGPG